jgi:glycolate oxidase
MAANYHKITPNDLEIFKKIVGDSCVLVDQASLEKYGHDETEDLVFTPEVVIKPNNTKEVAQILAHCHQYKIPVTPQGARTGLSGGALPLFGGIALSMERFNRIIFIDEKNSQLTVEPGVITQVLQEEVAKVGLFILQILPAKVHVLLEEISPKIRAVQKR